VKIHELLGTMSSRLAACFALAVSICAVLGHRAKVDSSLQVEKEGDDQCGELQTTTMTTFPCCKDQEPDRFCCQNEGNSGFKGLSCAKASFWTGEFPHCEKMVDAWENVNWKPVESRVIKFLRKRIGDHRGRMLEQLQKYSNSELQSQHEWLEWLFPTCTPTPLSPNAVALTADDVKLIKREEDLQQAIRDNFKIFAKFLGIKVEWKDGKVSISDGPDLQDRADNFWDTHTWMVFAAIDHVAKSLKLLGLETEAQEFKAKTKEIDEDNDFPE